MKSLITIGAIGLMSLFLASCTTTSTDDKKVSKSVTGTVPKMVAAEARKQGVPVNLALAVSKQESGHRCHVRGRAGELGPLQIKYQSARGFGYKGTRAQLAKSCALQIKWGMDHLRRAYKKGGTVWKAAYLHNSGIYAKSFRNRHATRYANSVSGIAKRGR